MAKSNLLIRFLTALIAGPAILLLIYLGQPWYFAVFVGVATMIGALELFAMTHADDKPSQIVLSLITVGVVGVLWQWGGSAKVLLALILLLPFVSMGIVLVRLGEMRTAALRVAAGAFGPLYLGGGLATLTLLRRDGGGDGPSFVLLTFMLSWFSDTGAYFAGRFLGKHKLYEAVSPKKTMEGAVGGLAAAVLGGGVAAHFLYLRSLPLVDGVVLSIVAGALGQAGDLGESLLKRSVGVKDSGGIVPGHGGILDRVDALLVTATLTYLYLIWVRGI
ncbi:MAG: phosphatidate cytidylyltransferase [Byssovorax sp.]